MESENSLLRPEDISAYLLLKGWGLVEQGGSASIWTNEQYASASQIDGRLLVPQIEQASDYGDRADMLVSELARLEGTPPRQVARDIALIHFDVVPVTATGSGVDDSIPLQSAQDIFATARKMVVSAAAATMRRQAHFGKTTPWAARHHAHSVRVGHTRRGSYVVPILSRARFGLNTVRSVDHLDVAVEEQLFDRRVMTTLAQALQTIETIVSGPDPASRGSEVADAVSVGVTRDLCLGITRSLGSKSISDLSVSFEWAPATTHPRGVPAEVRFSKEMLPPLESLSDRLLVLERPREDVIFGHVTDLKHRPGEPEGRVGVETIVGRRVRTVWMTLTPEQYAIARECHDRSKVVVRGVLRSQIGSRPEMDVLFFGPDVSLLDEGPLGVDT